MRYLCMSLCSLICSSVVSFFLFVFYRFYHICFPFPSFVFSVHNLSQRQVCGTVAKKNVFVYFPCCWALFSFSFVFACFFCNFLFCFILMYLFFFWRPCLVWSSFFSFLFLLSLFTYSPCSQEFSMEISKASRSPAWSLPVTMRVKRTWMTWWWSDAQQTNVTKRQRQNTDESWI